MRNYVWLMMLLSNGFAFGQSAPFTIKGNISAWKGKEQVALRYAENNRQIADTTTAVDGKFQFSGKVGETVSAVVVLISRPGSGIRDNRTFYMDRGLVTLTAPDSLKYAQIKGSKVTAEYEILQARVSPIINRLIAIRIKASKTSKEARQSPEFKLLEKEYRQLTDSVRSIRTTFIKQYPRSFVSLAALESVVGNPIDYGRGAALFESLAPGLKKLPLGEKMAKALAIAKTTGIGAVLPDFSSLDTLRKPLRLQDVVRKSKVTLVDFWASWCAPCRAENPNVVKAFNAFHDKGFNILSVSLDKSEAAWKKAIAADGMPWYHVSGLKYWDEPVVIQFGISGVPDNFLLDADGKVVARGLRGEALYKKIQSLLHKKDSIAGVVLKTNFLLIDSIQKVFNKEKDVKARAAVFNRLFDSAQGQEPFFARYKPGMQRDMAQHYASLNDVAAADFWISGIKDERVKAESVRLAAGAYADAGNKAQGMKMLKPVLDGVIQTDGSLNKAGLNTYTYALPVYLKMLGKGDEKEMLHYLKPLYQASGGYFPSDMSGTMKPDFNVRGQLFYQYARALSATGKDREAAEIISQAFQLGAVPSSIQGQVLADFSNVKHLDKYLKEFSTLGKNGFQKNLDNLLAKPDLNGKVWGTAALKGKYLLLDFWGSWCLPCRFTHPHLKEVYNKYKDKGFEIVGVSMEASPDLEKASQAWKKAVTEDGIPWIHLLNNENAARFDAVKSFGIGVFPTKILLDKEGRELARYSGGLSKDFDEKMKVVFGF